VKRILLGLASLAAMAQSTDDLDLLSPPPPSPNLTFKLGGQADSAQGQAFHGKVTWSASQALTLFTSGDKSNLASTTQAPSPNGNSTTTSTTSLGGAYSFGLVDLGLQYDHSDMSDLLSSERYTFQPALDGGTWRFGLEFSTRKTAFDRLPFRSLTLNTPTGSFTASGYADLNVSDTGLGANFELGGDVWRFYGSYARYSYGSFDGTTDVFRIRNASGTVSPEIFKALSGRLVSRIERISTSRLSLKASLLDSTATAGLEASLSRTKWAIEANRVVDHFTSESSNTYTGTASWKATPAFTLEFQVGATRSEAFGTDRFAGLALIFKTRPSLEDRLAFIGVGTAMVEEKP